MKKPKLNISEKQASKQITDWLNLYHVFWFYCPNKGRPYRSDGRYDTSRDLITPGAPDIIAITENNTVAIELKSSTGTQTKAQIEFQGKFEAVSGRNIYILARSVDDLIPIFGML